MSQSYAYMSFVNASSQPISGTATHLSGDGGGAYQNQLPVNNLGPFLSLGPPVQITVRNDHDDYWIWQPTNGLAVKLQRNLDGSSGAVMLVTDNLLVVVTSSHNVGEQSLPAAAQAAG